jgi:hypothetical protein
MPESRKAAPLHQRLLESVAGNFLTDVLRNVAGPPITALGGARMIYGAHTVLGTAFDLLLIIGGAYLMIYTLIARAQSRRPEASKSFKMALMEEAGRLLDEFEKVELWNTKADSSEQLDLMYPLSGNQFPGDVKQWKPQNKELFKWYAMYDCFARICVRTNIGRLPPLGSLLNSKKLVRVLNECQNGSFPSVYVQDMPSDSVSEAASA